MFQDDFDLIKEMLETVPGVKEHLESYSVLMGKIVLKRRIELGFTQEQLVEHIKTVTGQSITQSTISKMEAGANGIKGETYNKVLFAMGLQSMEPKFGRLPKSEELIAV